MQQGSEAREDINAKNNTQEQNEEQIAAEEQIPADEVVENEAEESANDEAEIDVEALLQQVKQLEEKTKEQENRILRVQADYDNYRRRSIKEKEELAKYAAENFVEQLLPVIDNFDRALETSKEASDLPGLIKGIEMIKGQFDQLLEKEGVTVIKAVGEPFDPVYHMAVMQVETDEHEEGTVVEEMQKGYMYKDKVIRPSMVKVSG